MSKWLVKQEVGIFRSFKLFLIVKNKIAYEEMQKNIFQDKHEPEKLDNKNITE